jgi:hypothetical protein
MEVLGFESHDSRLSMQFLSNGIWANNVLAVCRTGESLDMQTPKASKLEGSGFYWYDTAMEHIITQATFRNCGLRSATYDQYDTSPDRGCADQGDSNYGCSSSSTVFGFLTHSDQFNPEIMQGTRDITYENCGRRFRFTRDARETVSGRLQNWLDVDGTASGLGEPTLIASGLEGAKDWWGIEDTGEQWMQFDDHRLC